MKLIEDRNPAWTAAMYFVLEQARKQSVGVLSVLIVLGCR